MTRVPPTLGSGPRVIAIRYQVDRYTAGQNPGRLLRRFGPRLMLLPRGQSILKN